MSGKVLIIRFSALGDVAMTIPQVYSVCRAYPHVTFVMLTQKVASTLFINRPENLQLFVAEVYTRHKGMLGLWRLARELQMLGIDTVIDLHDVMRSQYLRLLLRMMGKKVYILDKGRAEKRLLVARNHKVKKQLTTSAQRYHDAFERAGLGYEPHFVSLYGDGRGDVATFSHLSPEKASGEHWIGIAPFAKHEGKIYPLELMEKVVEKLSREKDVKLFLFGAGQYEASILGAWREKYPRVTSLADVRNGFPVELALISHLDVMLSMDSANMHLAALVNTPVVSIWGATHRYAGFLGYGVSSNNIIEIDMPCRPCSVFGDKPCYRGDYACLHRILVDNVYSKLLSFIDVTL